MGSNPTPRAYCKPKRLDLIIRKWDAGTLVRRKTVKPKVSAPRNVTTGLCPKCGTIGKILIIGATGMEKGKCQACNAEFTL